ncbi:hypothetical protein ACP4OV_009841 [Aristida adscensionis]
METDSSLSTGGSSTPQRRRPAMSEEEKILRAVERAIERSNAARRAAKASPSPWRRLVRMATKKKSRRPAGVSKNRSPAAPASPRSSSGLPSRSRIEREGWEPAAADFSDRRASSVLAAVGSSSEAGADDDDAGQGAAQARSACAAMMKRALARIQSEDVGDAGEAFADTEQAMKDLMEASFGERIPVLPTEFMSRLPRGDLIHEVIVLSWKHVRIFKIQLFQLIRERDWSQRDIIVDPLILASGDSIDKFSHEWSSLGSDQPLLAAPNHLLRDVITAWCLDHSIPPPATTAISDSIDDAPPSEEEMPSLLEKLSMHSLQQQEALHRIQLLSASSKGVQPCLDQWQDLLPTLMDLHKKWKATWSRELEEERLTIMLNLSLHRPNREILAQHVKLPKALKKTTIRAKKLGYPFATMAKVSAIIAALSEFNSFREKVVENGGIPMLCVMLDTKDALVRNEASAAILALCSDDAALEIALLSFVPDALLECLSDGVVTDQCLLLLERTAHGELVPDWTVANVAPLMRVITRYGRGHVTSRGIESAVRLIYNAVQKDAGRLRMKASATLEHFVVALRNMVTRELALETVFQIQEILMIGCELLSD